MLVEITRHGKPEEFPAEAAKVGTYPLVYDGSGPVRIGEFGVTTRGPTSRVGINGLDTGLTITVPDGLRGVVTATGAMVNTTPDSRYGTAHGLEIADGTQYFPPGEHKLVLFLRSIRSVAGFVPVQEGQVVGYLRFEDIPKAQVNTPLTETEKPKRRGRPPKVKPEAETEAA